MNILLIIGIVVAIIGIILIILINQYNYFQWTNVLIEKGENNLEITFTKKHNILMRYLDILKDNKVDILEEDYNKFKNINTSQSVNKTNKSIEELVNFINQIMDNNEKLLKKEAIININKELNQINISINGGKKYYNDNLVLYNHLCNAFPSNIIAKLKKYRENDFLNSEAKEELKILDGEDE